MKQDATESRETWSLWDGGHLDPGWPVKGLSSQARGTIEYMRDGLMFVRWEFDDEFTYGFKPRSILVLQIGEQK